MKIHNPPMTFKDDQSAKQWKIGLDKNTDPYGRAVYRYASEWATRMEKSGETIEVCAKRLSRESDDEGITGFMYGCAVNILASLWIHGEELRKWHNLDCQIGDEGEKANESGGVLNPAIINVRTK